MAKDTLAGVERLVIALEGVEKRWPNGTVAVQGLDLEVTAGEFLALVGPSGSGKTTTLKLVNRLVEASRGIVRVDGRDVRDKEPWELRRSIGMVFQRFALFPHMTLFDNVAVVPRLCRWTEDAIRKRVHELLDLVDLEPSQYADRFPAELSGGQQQRVGIARALAARPKVLLMDEPMGALDPMTRQALMSAFRGLHDALGLTTLMVTHDMSEALLTADRVAVLHQGELLQLDTPERLVAHPAHDVVRALVHAPRHQAERLGALWEAP
ncbi:MAG: ATP-binding cassette domain-containing protein [Polyangiaceae bacterium]